MGCYHNLDLAAKPQPCRRSIRWETPATSTRSGSTPTIKSHQAIPALRRMTPQWLAFGGRHGRLRLPTRLIDDYAAYTGSFIQIRDPHLRAFVEGQLDAGSSGRSR